MFRKQELLAPKLENCAFCHQELGYLTHEKATEMEGLMVEAQMDYEYLLEVKKKKDDADKLKC